MRELALRQQRVGGPKWPHSPTVAISLREVAPFKQVSTVGIENGGLMAKKGKRNQQPQQQPPRVRETLRDFVRRLAPYVASGVLTAVTARHLIRSHPLADAGTQTISGHGKYTVRDAFRDLSTGAGTAAGGMVGAAAGPFGIGIGSAIGGGLGRELGGLIAGHGAYTVAHNSIANNGYVIPEGTQIPSFKLGDNSTAVYHREYCFDVVVPSTPAAFSNNAYVITPTNTTLFPWLATMAANFQQYSINGMVFEFRATSSDITAGGSLGTVIMASDYNVIDVNFSSKMTMENSQYATSCKPSVSMVHAIECDPKMRPTENLFTRAVATTTSNYDARFYDFAKLQVATQGLPGVAGTTLGEMWVTYDITLSKPILGNGSAVGTGSTFPTSGVSSSNPFGTARTINNLANYVVTSNSITSARAGQAQVIFYAVGTGFTPLTLTFIGGASVSTPLQAGPQSGLTSQVFTATITFTQPGDGFTMNTVGWSSITSSFTYITTTS